ncbi:hypothetical protein INR49_019354, partial [Caranx melampygus]
MTSQHSSHAESTHSTDKQPPAVAPKLQVQRSLSKETITIHFSAFGKEEEEEEEEEEMYTTTLSTISATQDDSNIVTALEANTSQGSSSSSSSTPYRFPEPRLNLQLFKQFTQARMPTATTSSAGDSKTAPSSPLVSPDNRSFFKVSDVEARIEDTKRRLSEVISEPFQLLSKIMDEKGSSSIYRPKALSVSASELSNITSINGHLESNNNYCIKEEEGGDWEAESLNTSASDRPESPVSFTVDTKSPNRSSSLSMSLDKCSMSALAKQEDEDFCILYSDDYDTCTDTEGGGDRTDDTGSSSQTKVPLSGTTEPCSEDESESIKPISSVPHYTLIFLTFMVYGYFVLPLPSYIGGVLLGIGLGFLLAIGVVWLTGPKPSGGFKHSRYNRKLWSRAKLDIKEPDIYKGWMNEISNYDPEMYHATLTHSVYVRLEGSIIRLSKPNHNIARRATHNEPKPDVNYVSQKIYDITNSKVYLMPPSLARKRVWNKKYPICIELGKQDDFMSKAEGDRCEASEGVHVSDRGEASGGAQERGISSSSSRDLTLYLFARTGRQKEEWFQRFLSASRFKADLRKTSIVAGSKSALSSHSRSSSRSSLDEALASQPRSKDSSVPSTAASSAKTKLLLDYSVYMASLLPEQVTVSPTAASPVLQSPQSSPGADKKLQSPTSAEVQPRGEEEETVAWMNVALGRVFWDFLNEPYWADLVSKKIQMKLSKIRLPYFMNELTLTELDMGFATPRILQASNPSIDYRGKREISLWFDLEVSYSGSFLMTLETKMNLIRLGKEGESLRLGEFGKDGNRPRTYCLADSDEESSSAGSSDEEDSSDITNESAGAEGFVGGHKPSKIMRFVDKITKSKYFQKATETEFIKKKMEEVSNTPLLLTVELQELQGTLAVNIPPPPTDRIWYGFRTPPHLELKARPKLGEREVTLAHKILVMPNMDDVWLTIMHSAMDPRTAGGPLVVPPVDPEASQPEKDSFNPLFVIRGPMQRTEGEGGEGAREDGSPNHDVENTKQQEEPAKPAEDWGATTPSEVYMDDLRPLPEEGNEEELIVLDPEHPLVRRYQAALNSQLRKQLERINLELSEKLAEERAVARYINVVDLELYTIQDKLLKLNTKLEDQHQTKAQAEAKRQQAQAQLEAAKSRYSATKSRCSKAKANVSQLQTELDNLHLHLIFTQGVSEDLHSNVKAMKNAKRKAGAERDQAKEQKLKQDLYVERLTKDMERLTQQAEVRMDSLVMSRQQLLQQWNSNLAGMKRQDEAFIAMQEATREVEHQGILLDREIEGYKKSNTEEQEQNEALTTQLNWSQMDIATSKKLISQKKAQQDALQAHYSTSLRTLRETESTLARLTKEKSIHQADVNDQRRQLEKESAMRLELEEQIMTHMQQKLTHNKAAKNSQQLISKMTALKKEKMSQLWHLENAMVAVGLETSDVSQHLDSLAVTQEALEEEIAKYNKLITSNQAKVSSLVELIRQKQFTIACYNRKISQITASTGNEDLSPLQIKTEALTAQIEELSASIKSDQQLWMRQQGILVGLTQEIEANSRNMLKLQTEHMTMQQKKIHLESQIEAEHQEQTEMEKNVKILRGDLLKLNTLIGKNGQLSQALEQENALMETDFLRRLKEAERESIEMQMKHERTQEEKERLLNCVVEAERQIMLWEKKTQLVKETRSAVDSELGKGDIKKMKAQIHRMEVKLNKLMKQREKLLRDSEAAVARRETIVLRREAIINSSRQQTTKGELNVIIQGLQRKIQDTHKHVSECDRGIRELQESKDSLNDRLAQQKQRLIDLCGTSSALDSDLMNLQDTKDRNLNHLVVLQSRAKKLQGVCEGNYQALSTRESVETALQSQMERVHSIDTILHHVCEEFPQHQGALRKLMSGECVPCEGPDLKSMGEEELWELINDNRHRISLGVRPCIVIPYLRQARVLTEMDEDEIVTCHNLTNRSMRTSYMLDLLRTQGRNGAVALLESLMIHYPTLYTQITGRKPSTEPSRFSGLIKYSELTEYLVRAVTGMQQELQEARHEANRMTGRCASLESEIGRIMEQEEKSSRLQADNECMRRHLVSLQREVTKLKDEKCDLYVRYTAAIEDKSAVNKRLHDLNL